MAESRICKADDQFLKQILRGAQPPQKYLFHPKEAAFHLSRAFSIFSREVEELKAAYAKLQEKWTNVNEKLEKTIEELTRLERYMDAVSKQISQGILAIRMDGTIHTINEAAQKILKIEDRDVVGKKVETVFSPDLFGFSLKEALAFGLAPKILYKTYQEKLLEISPIFFYEGQRSQQSLILLLKDISEVKQLQLTLDRNERLQKLGSMVATVAHEIRNPLGGIRGFAALLFRDLKTMPHLQEMAQSVIEGTHYLENLVTTVLQYAKPIPMNIQPIEMGQFLRQIVKLVKIDPAFPEKIQTHLHLPFQSCVLSIDSDALKSALLNLLFNAIQAMGEKGLLTLALTQRETTCQIEISDTGTGMTEEELARLFSPFYTTKQKGNGLGLVEVQKIVQAHLGSIDVRSSPQKGSTFTITLPLKR